MPEQSSAYRDHNNVERQRYPFEAELVAPEAVPDVFPENQRELLRIARVCTQPGRTSFIKHIGGSLVYRRQYLEGMLDG